MESGGIRDDVQRVIDDLRKAGEKATGDVRTSIDSAVSRLRDVSDEAQGRVRGATSGAQSRVRDAAGGASGRAQEQISSWRSTLESATEDVRRELGRLAVRAQSSLESVEDLAKELDERRKSLGGGGKK